MDPAKSDVFKMGELVDDGACNGVVLGGASDEDGDGVAGLVVRDGEAGGGGGIKSLDP